MPSIFYATENQRLDSAVLIMFDKFLQWFKKFQQVGLIHFQPFVALRKLMFAERIAD